MCKYLSTCNTTPVGYVLLETLFQGLCSEYSRLPLIRLFIGQPFNDLNYPFLDLSQPFNALSYPFLDFGQSFKFLSIRLNSSVSSSVSI